MSIYLINVFWVIVVLDIKVKKRNRIEFLFYKRVREVVRYEYKYSIYIIL